MALPGFFNSAPQPPGLLNDTDYTQQYNTNIPSWEAGNYTNWLTALSQARGHDIRQDTRDYDLGAYFMSGYDRSPQGHFNDVGKKPSHPTFSTGSVHSTPQTPGGQWLQSEDGSWRYYPNQFNVLQQGADAMRRYFQSPAENPGSRLVLPQTGLGEQTPLGEQGEYGWRMPQP